jgi:hypothetical protein
LDRVQRLRERIDSDGELLIGADGQVKAHPLLPAETSNRSFITRTLRALGVTLEPVKSIGRPPGSAVWWWPTEPTQRERLPTVTAEMVTLFARGLQLAAEGHDDVSDHSEAHWEFVRLSKRLEWDLIKLPLHAASVFDAEVDGPPPAYLKPSHAQFQDWSLVQSWRRALQAALDARRRKA